jgi:two-component system response regulator DevR
MACLPCHAVGVGEPVRLFLVSTAVAIRRALAKVLDAEAGITVVGQARTSAEALRRIPAARPDVVLTGDRVWQPRSPELCRRIRDHDPHIQVLIVGIDANQAFVADAIAAGAAGVLPHTIDENELVDAITTAAAGRMVVTTDTLSRILGERGAGVAVPDPLADLTKLEKELFELVGDGLTNAEIAQTLRLSPGTVRNYVSRLLRKLEVDRRAQVIAMAARRQTKDVAR